MDESSDKGLDKGESTEPEAPQTDNVGSAATSPAAASGNGAPNRHLIVVKAPRLAGEETIEASNDAAAETAAAASSGAPRPRSSRLAVLAATIALAAALGSFVGSLTASEVMRLLPSGVADSQPTEPTNVLQGLRAQSAQLSAIKAGLDGANHSANVEFAKIADRLNRIETAAADPAAKLAHIADTVDRLDKRSAAAPETTGSIASSTPPPSEPKLTDRVLEDWVVADVRGGRALVESRYGGEFIVGAGSVLPRLGAVQAVKRQDGQWVVVTAHGVITSGR